jgi:hypothetical protein
VLAVPLVPSGVPILIAALVAGGWGALSHRAAPVARADTAQETQP